MTGFLDISRVARFTTEVVRRWWRFRKSLVKIAGKRCVAQKSDLLFFESQIHCTSLRPLFSKACSAARLARVPGLPGVRVSASFLSIPVSRSSGFLGYSGLFGFFGCPGCTVVESALGIRWEWECVRMRRR